MARTRRKAERGTRAFVGVWIDCFAKHNLLTYASSIAFHILKGAVRGERGVFDHVRAALGQGA